MFDDLSKSWISETAETQNVNLVFNSSALPAEGGGEVGLKWQYVSGKLSCFSHH